MALIVNRQNAHVYCGLFHSGKKIDDFIELNRDKDHDIRLYISHR
ncbi:hypothetical protein HNQ88_003363 [Aureibacter tunicatorum]|uniref:Uncharacterized protein n=1 Tax=Aureibacter tunicatorum TaxID=866807 RepID=A0AAE4BU32_9BACT|nr:hypothetical protein [Aureibacter tunicatorum]BDD05822.1 hypothetical protein AUTU_33050 [Aureibacter tunicatorum]